VVLDQSVYVKASIGALVQEGVLGAILCSLTILMFLGEWKMTAIAIMTLPLSVLSACVCLYATKNTINVMTLAGLTLAIGPMVDSAIICLENTERHLKMGAVPVEAAFLGASEVALPELVATICTFLVLTPLTLVPGLGTFLFKPMAMAVAFAMISAYILSRTLVPSRSAMWLKGHEGGHDAGHAHGDSHATHGEQNGQSDEYARGQDQYHADSAQVQSPIMNGNGNGRRSQNPIARAYAKWQGMIDKGIEAYCRALDFVLRNRIASIGVAVGWLVLVLIFLTPILRKEFFPEVDAGAFEMYVRGPAGTRVEITNQIISEVE
jgi:multidrug efflux pump subunit AcrB